MRRLAPCSVLLGQGMGNQFSAIFMLTFALIDVSPFDDV
jgi:hypothetical protein